MSRSRFSLRAWGSEDSRDSIRHKIGSWLLKQAVRIIPIKEFKKYEWESELLNENKRNIVISNHRIDYLRDYSFENGHPLWVIKHPDDGILGAYLFWKDAMNAASILSQHFDDYHFSEHVYHEETERVIIAENYIEELERNLSVEKIWVNRDFDWDEWENKDTLINSDTTRTLSELEIQLSTGDYDVEGGITLSDEYKNRYNID